MKSGTFLAGFQKHPRKSLKFFLSIFFSLSRDESLFVVADRDHIRFLISWKNASPVRIEGKKHEIEMYKWHENHQMPAAQTEWRT